MDTPRADHYIWHKSTYSGGSGGNCVEVGRAPEHVGIRDTKNRDLGHLTVSAAAWRTFIKAITR